MPGPGKGIQRSIRRSLGTYVDSSLQNRLTLRTRTINARPERRTVYLGGRRAVGRDLGRRDRDSGLRRASVAGDYCTGPIQTLLDLGTG